MLEKYFIVAILMFVIGIIGVLKRQNLIMLFISSEIMLNAANLALVGVSKLHNDLNGQVFALFIMGIAACEIAVGVALCVLWYRRVGSLELKSLKEVENPNLDLNPNLNLGSSLDINLVKNAHKNVSSLNQKEGV